MERIRTPSCVHSRSVRSRLTFAMNGEHLLRTGVALFIPFATMAAIPVASEIALARRFTPSKPPVRPVRDSQGTKTNFVLPATTTTPLMIQPWLLSSTTRDSGRIGHFVFLYNSEEFVARLNRLPRTGPRPTYSVQSILPDRMSTGHLTRGAMSIIPPNLNHGDIGIFATAHTAGAQSTTHTSTAQRSSINIGGSLFGTPSESSRSRLDYHDSIAPRIPGAQLTASSSTLQQTSTDTRSGPFAASSNNLTNATHPHIQGYVPPTAFAPDTSFTQSPGVYSAPDFDASGRLSSSDRTFNNPYPGIRPRPQSADAHPKDESSISYANHTIALEPSQTTRKAPSQAQASTDSARAGASSASASLDTQESWGTRLRETILAEADPLRFPLPTPATGGAPPFNPQSQFMTAPAPAPARAGMSPSLATLQDQGVTGSIRPPRPRRSAGTWRCGTARPGTATRTPTRATSGSPPGASPRPTTITPRT